MLVISMSVITVAKYGFQCDWEKVKNHLMGIWHRHNNSLDLVELHHHFQDIQKSRINLMDPASLTQQVLQELNGNMLKYVDMFCLVYYCNDMFATNSFLVLWE